MQTQRPDTSEASDDGSDNTAAARNFAAYLAKFIPLERSTEWSTDESALIAALCREAAEDWAALPSNVQLNVIRAYETEKERLKTTVRQTKRIAAYRREHQLELWPGNVDTKAIEEFETSWPMRIAGVDNFGHVVLVDKVVGFKIDRLLSMDLSDMMHIKAQELEAVQYLKGEIADRLGHRVCKHVYIIDLAGLEARHFSARFKAVLQPLMSMTTDFWPETLWSLWLINAPSTFRLVWSVVRSMLDPIVRAKVRMFGSRSKWLPAMTEVGIPTSALPVDLGGSAPTETFANVIARAKLTKGVEDL